MTLAEAPPSTLRDYQQRAVDELRAAVLRSGSVVYQLPTGGGKCHPAGTELLMHDGRLRRVEDIEVGDRLMGPDSEPRVVQRLGRGHGPIVEIQPIRGEPWRCNEDHVLTLVRTPSRREPCYPSEAGGDWIDVSVRDWRAWSDWRKHIHKLIRVGVEWPERDLPIDPYFLGLLIGDGSLKRSPVKITTLDPEIVQTADEQAEAWGLSLHRVAGAEWRAPTYEFTSGRRGGAPNPLTEAIRRLNLDVGSREKHLPHDYRTASREQRLALLAGLMDTDGHLHHEGFDYVSASATLADDVSFLARSVGLTVTLRPKRVAEQRYWRLHISGDCSIVPTRLPRKRAAARTSRKDPGRSGFEIASVGDDDFYGFELDGDGRYLLADFTVTHNTVVASEIARLGAAKGSRTLFVVHRRELVRQAIDTLEEAVPGMSIGVEAAGWPSMPWALLQVGMVQSIARRKETVDPDIVIWDEAHHARATTWETTIARFPRAKHIGLTATPERRDGKGLGEHFAEMIHGPSIKELVAAGWLAPTRTMTVPVGLDLSGVPTDKYGEYQRKAAGERVTDTVVVGAANAYCKHAMGRPAIFFGIHRNHSKRVCAELRERGVRAEHVDGDDPSGRRDRIMNALRTGGLDVVGNCDLISEGFDAPACEVVILGARTKSVTRYLQMAGRAMRPGPGKTALVLDCAEIVHELGLPDEERAWSLEDGIDESQDRGKTQPRRCANCGAMFRGPRCRWCLHEVPMSEIAEVDVELVEATPEQFAGRKRRGRRSDLQRKVAATRHSPNERAELEAIAAERGYHPGWVGHILRARGRE